MEKRERNDFYECKIQIPESLDYLVISNGAGEKAHQEVKKEELRPKVSN